MQRFVKVGAVLALAIGAQLWSASARAQASAESKAAAEALFDEGKKAMSAGDFARACPKFEQSESLDPAIGTELNLASCYEKIGKTASAWAMYRKVAAAARAKGQLDREKTARERADALEPELSRLTVLVPETSRAAGLVVRRNRANVEQALWGQAVPVDPGTLAIEASAPGRRPWSTAVELGARSAITVTVPALEVGEEAVAPETAPAAPVVTMTPVAPQPAYPPRGEPAPPEANETGSTQRVLGLVVAGVGLVGAGIGGYFAYQATSKNDESKDYCLPADPNQCSARGLELRDDARSAGNLATVAGGIGLVGLAAGAVLYFTAPTPTQRTSVGLRSSRNGASFVLGGSF